MLTEGWSPQIDMHNKELQYILNNVIVMTERDHGHVGRTLGDQRYHLHVTVLVTEHCTLALH